MTVDTPTDQNGSDASVPDKFSAAALWRDAPLSFAYAIGIAACWIVGIVSSKFLMATVLSPPDVVGSGQFWRLLTYPLAHSPASLLHPVMVMTLIAFFGWYVEPTLSRRATMVLLLGSALVGGAVYVVVEPIAIFIGGAFVAVGYAAAFSTWAFRSRKRISSRRRSTAFGIGIALVLYILASPPPGMAGAASAALVGFLVGQRAQLPRAA